MFCGGRAEVCVCGCVYVCLCHAHIYICVCVYVFVERNFVTAVAPQDTITGIFSTVNQYILHCEPTARSCILGGFSGTEAVATETRVFKAAAVVYLLIAGGKNSVALLIL